MIRFLLPRHTFNEHRIRLVERLTNLQIRSFANVKRVSTYLEQSTDSFYEGFLENESKLKIVAERLADNPVFIKQDVLWDVTPTWVVEDVDDLNGLPY